MQQRPQNVTDVLCREVGASHPDGALRQIRTMKRVLRMHYRSQKKLERFGVSDCTEAIACISDLRALVQKARTLHRKQAQANIQTVDEAIALLRESMQQLRDSARPAEALPGPADPSTPDASSPRGSHDPISAHETSPPRRSDLEQEVQIGDGAAEASPEPEELQAGSRADTSLSSLDAFETVAAQLDELRLELWIEAGRPEAQNHASADAEDSLTDAEPILDRMERVMQSVMEQNHTLRESCQNLQERNRRLSVRLQHCQRRIDMLEQQISP